MNELQEYKYILTGLRMQRDELEEYYKQIQDSIMLKEVTQEQIINIYELMNKYIGLVNEYIRQYGISEEDSAEIDAILD